MKCVIDASFLASLFLPDEASEKSMLIARRLAAGDATAPALLQLEIANILLMAERRKRINGQQLKTVMDAIDRFAVSLQPVLAGNHLWEVMRLAQKHHLSAYDAAYLELAMRMHMTLATLDEPLRRSAKAEGVEIVP